MIINCLTGHPCCLCLLTSRLTDNNATLETLKTTVYDLGISSPVISNVTADTFITTPCRWTKNGSVWWVLKYTPFYSLGDSYHCWLHVFMRKFRFVSRWREKTYAGSWNGTVHAYWDCPSSDWWHELKSSQDSDDVLEKMNLHGSLSTCFRWQGLWTKFFTMLCPLGYLLFETIEILLFYTLNLEWKGDM